MSRWLLLAACVVLAQAAPKINFVTNAGYFAGNTIAPGTFVSIYGSDLAASTLTAPASGFPLSLGGVRVLVCPSNTIPDRGGCNTMRIVFVSPGQINFRMEYPTATASSYYATVTFNNAYDIDFTAGNREYPVRIIRNAVTPGVFAAGFDCQLGIGGACGLSQIRQDQLQVMRAMITDTAYRPIHSLLPAKPGDSFIIWATGLGYPEVSGDLRSRLRTELTYRFKLNGTGPLASLPVTALYAGGAPGFPGLYQINFVLPPAAAKSGGACGVSREGTLELSEVTATLAMPFPMRAAVADAVCQ